MNKVTTLRSYSLLSQEALKNVKGDTAVDKACNRTCTGSCTKNGLTGTCKSYGSPTYDCICNTVF